jgi:hypothetical protein
MAADSPKIAPERTDAMGYFYSVFGLILHSNASIPGLRPVEKEALSPDVEVFLQSRPASLVADDSAFDLPTYSSATLAESGDPMLRVYRISSCSLFRVEYYDGVKFWLNSAGRNVWATWPESSSIEDVATYLLGPMLGFLLRLRGTTCLHASAVALENSAIAFAGVQGAGKSTTAAAMARRGHTVISDDIVALTERDGKFLVLPAYPYLSLWPESVDLLYGSRSALPAFSKNWDKRQLALAENSLHFAAGAFPLAAIYLLAPRTGDAKAPFVESPAPTESLLALVADTYANNLIDNEMRAKEFELLGRLLKAVPVLRLHPHQDGSRIDQLCQLIERAEHPGLDHTNSAATSHA